MSENKSTTPRKIKILYIVFSIIIAVALWMYISYIEDPETTTVISGIPIEFVGEEILLDNNLAITDINISELNITFSGRWGSLANLSNSNMKAVVDLSKISSQYGSQAGTYMLSYTIEFDDSVSSSSIEIVRQNYNSVTVVVEKLISVSVPVRGTFEGEIAAGYIAEPLIYSTDYITVSGPQNEVSQISYAWVTLVRDNLSKSISEESEIILMDENGMEIDTENLILSQNTVTVTLNILMVKEVPLTVNLAYCATAYEENTRCTIDPDVITISGDPDVLSGINQIVLGTVDLTSFSSTLNETFNIVIPNDVTNITGETSATVIVEILGMSTRRLSVSNIQYRNATSGYVVDVITQSLDVTIRGEEDLIAEVNSEGENIRIVADLADLGNTTGTFTVDAKVYVDGDGFNDVDAIGDYKVTVQISLPVS